MGSEGKPTAYDVVVAGARCGGSALAMLLARAGHRVAVVDRATFPSDTISTHFVQLSGVARLARWGLLEAVQASGCPPVREAAIDFGQEPLVVPTDFGTSLPGNYAPRRTVLDKILVDAARDAGAEVREGCYVEDVTFEDGRAAGLLGRDGDGARFELRGRLVVGADGRNSVVANRVGADIYESVLPLTWGYYSYWSGVDVERAELYLRDRRFTVAFPTNDGLTTIGVAFPTDESDERRNSEKRFLETLDMMGTLGERVRAGRREERITGLREIPNFLRTPWGPGWALVGDAGYHKDPSPAQGISDAFRDADHLAAAIDDVLTGRATEEEALAGYHAARDERAKPMLKATETMSSFETPPPERAQAFVDLVLMQADDLGSFAASSAS